MQVSFWDPGPLQHLFGDNSAGNPFNQPPQQTKVKPVVALTGDDVGVDGPRVLVGGHLQLDPATAVQAWHRTPANHARRDLPFRHFLHKGQGKELPFSGEEDEG